jgi:hypothetical protein
MAAGDAETTSGLIRAVNMVMDVIRWEDRTKIIYCYNAISSGRLQVFFTSHMAEENHSSDGERLGRRTPAPRARAT